MRNSRPYLFSDYDLRQTLENQFQNMLNEVNGMGEDQLLNTSVDDMITYLNEKYNIEQILIHEDGINVDQTETEIDVSRDQMRSIRDRSKPFYIKGTSNKFFVPYSGDKTLFQCKPSTSTLSPPVAVVTDGELILNYDTTDHDAAGIRDLFNRELTEINRHVEWVNNQVASHNATK